MDERPADTMAKIDAELSDILPEDPAEVCGRRLGGEA